MAGFGFNDDIEQQESPLKYIYTPGTPKGLSVTPEGQSFVDGQSPENYSLPSLKPDQGLSSPSYNPVPEMFAGISPEGMASPLKSITPPSTSVKSPLNYPKDSIYGVPISDLTRVLGTTAHAIAPNSWGGRLGKGMSELADQDEANRLRQQQLNQNYEMGMGHVTEDKRMGDLRLRQFDLAEKKMQEADEQVKYQNDLVDSIANDPVAVKEISDRLRISEEFAKKYISSHRGEMFKQLPSLMGSSAKDIVPEHILNDLKIPEWRGATWEQAGKLIEKAYEKKLGLGKPENNDAYKVGHIQQVQRGRNLAYIEYAGNGKWIDRKDLGGGPKDSPQGEIGLSPAALTALAGRFDVSGEIPGLGLGKKATEARAKILNTWADDLSNKGESAQDQITRQASYRAAKQELSALQSQRGKVMAFATTAEKNLNLAVSLSEKVDRTGSPVVNRWLLAGKRSLAGDPDVAAFDAALRTGINEYAKVTSSATGGGVTSDQARKEVESMLNAAQTPAQIKSVFNNVLIKDLANRREGYDRQIDEIKGMISGKGKTRVSGQLPNGYKVGW
jgi:hypothetical protein